MPAVQALQQIIQHPPTGEYRFRLRRVVRSVEAGATLAEALGAEGHWLPEFDLALVQAGEQSGRLVETCRSLATHYTDRARLVEGFLAKLLYPVLLFHFAVLVFPPDLLPGLVWRGEVEPFLRQKFLFLGPLYLVVGLLIVLVQSRRYRGWRALVESVLRLVPGLGSARRELALARLAATLEALISAGVGIVEAWSLAAAASGSPALERAVVRWRPRVAAGEPPSEQLNRSRAFPELFCNLYATGELSGQLDQELRHLHAYYQESGTRKLDRFALILAGMVMLAVMGAIAYWVVSFWLGYYNKLFESI